MGNTNSNQVEEGAYNDYINEQKRIIMAQQEQIQRLSRMNLRQNIINNQPAVPTNIMFQQNNPVPKVQSGTHKLELPRIKNKVKLDPYRILGIDRGYDEKMLKRAYLRMAMKTHPDKGGNADDFQKVSIAYTVLLKKLNDIDNNHNHSDMKNQSRNYMESNSGLRNVNLSDNFDGTLFNKIYEDNRILSVNDDGYGNWMKQNHVGDVDVSKKFNGKFNKNLFNREFDKYKTGQQKNMGNQVVKYEEPKVDISYKGSDSLMILGQGKIENFSGGGDNGLVYRDYRDAYTNTCLIDTNDVRIGNRARNVNDIEVQRSNIQYQMSEGDIKRAHMRNLQEEKNEMMRREKLKKNDNIAFDNYNRIHQRMIGS